MYYRFVRLRSKKKNFVMLTNDNTVSRNFERLVTVARRRNFQGLGLHILGKAAGSDLQRDRFHKTIVVIKRLVGVVDESDPRSETGRRDRR